MELLPGKKKSVPSYKAAHRCRVGRSRYIAIVTDPVVCATVCSAQDQEQRAECQRWPPVHMQRLVLFKLSEDYFGILLSNSLKRKATALAVSKGTSHTRSCPLQALFLSLSSRLFFSGSSRGGIAAVLPSPTPPPYGSWKRNHPFVPVSPSNSPNASPCQRGEKAKQ